MWLLRIADAMTSLTCVAEAWNVTRVSTHTLTALARHGVVTCCDVTDPLPDRECSRVGINGT